MCRLSCETIFPTVSAGRGIDPGIKLTETSLLPYFFLPSVMLAHPNVPPLQAAAVIDSACPSSPREWGRDRQSVSVSLSTWQSRWVQPRWNNCLHCFVCIRTKAARFPIGTPSCSPSRWQPSQLLLVTYFYFFFIFLLCCSSFPSLSPSVSSSSSLHASSETDTRQLLFLAALFESPAGRTCSELTLQLFSTGSIIFHLFPLTGYQLSGKRSISLTVI